MSNHHTKLRIKLKLAENRIKQEGKLFDMSQRHLEICENALIAVQKSYKKEKLDHAECKKELNSWRIAAAERHYLAHMNLWERVKFVMRGCQI